MSERSELGWNGALFGALRRTAHWCLAIAEKDSPSHDSAAHQ